MKFKIRQTWKYTIDVEVEADSHEEALELSNSADGEPNGDDMLEDARVLSFEGAVK